MQVRAQRTFLERNDPILLDRMRGVAAAYGKSIEDDGWDFTTLGFTDLRAGCSIVHLPPSSTANGKSVVSRDYDFTTGALSFGFLPPGMLHPTARPYLIELHPDQGYASIAMVAYDLLSGVLDGMNSEGLTVTMALDAELFDESPEPTRVPAVGLGELQTMRLLLDTCATVEEAKETLLATKQYYQYVPVHYLIADRNGNAFVWEYSEAHNKEYVVALREANGEELWRTEIGAVRDGGGGYPGPRCSPTVDGDLIYALGLNGDLLCLTADEGTVRWRKDLRKDFKGNGGGWGYSESPLVDGDKVLCTPGGRTTAIAIVRPAQLVYPGPPGVRDTDGAVQPVARCSQTRPPLHPAEVALHYVCIRCSPAQPECVRRPSATVSPAPR